ncbi:MAG: hypothetical protein ACRDZ5_00030 [Acidimicrobiales bacterium]
MTRRHSPGEHPDRGGSTNHRADGGETTASGYSTITAGAKGGQVDELIDRSTFFRCARLAAGVIAEDVLGIICIFAVPFHRPSGWIPPVGVAVYLAHAIFGFALVTGAGALILHVRTAGRVPKGIAWLGAAGLAISSIGGLLTSPHQRAFGTVLMAVGSLWAAVCYLLPVLMYMKQKSSLRASPEAPGVPSVPGAPGVPGLPL